MKIMPDNRQLKTDNWMNFQGADVPHYVLRLSAW